MTSLHGKSSTVIVVNDAFLFSILMNNLTVVFDPCAAAARRNMVQTIVDNHNVAITGQAEWYPVAFFLGTKRARYWAVCSETSGRLGYTSERLPWPRLREDMALAGN